MGELNITLSVPYSSEPTVQATVSASSTIGDLFQRAVHVFNAIPNISSYEILVSLTDGTYAFAGSEEALGNFNIPKAAKVILVPKEYEVEVTYESLKPFKIMVAAREPTQSIVTHVCEQIGSMNPKDFILADGDFALIDSLSLAEQRPGVTKLQIVDSSSESIKVKFMDVYLRGPVYLSYSDALNLSAYLLQATKGPSRCYKGTSAALNNYMPKRFQSIAGAGEELFIHWEFLRDTTRTKAIKLFTSKVQLLPLFNCTSFSGERMRKDKTSNLPQEFEIIVTDKRLIFLDYKLFKTRISIAYRDLLEIERDDDEIEITYSDDAENIKKVKFETNTSKSLLRKLIEVNKSEEEAENYEISGSTQNYVFHKIEELKEDKNRIQFFPTDFIYKFVNTDETEPRITYFELMHALLIRADSCAWHLSVLIGKAKNQTLKSFKNELVAYYKRMMAYLTYLTYDYRPYDTAIDLGPVLLNLENETKKAKEIIQEVLKNLSFVKQMFIPISSDAIYVSSNNVIAYVLSHLFSNIEFKYATTESNKLEVFDQIIKEFNDNFIQMKEYIRQYIFSVGSVDFKNDLQKTLDFVFTHFLLSLDKLSIIVDTSEFKQLDPSIILHQDSCNIMMENIVQFSHLIWADRQALSQDHLAKFLEQAAMLANSLLSDTTKYNLHVSAISQFLKIARLNLVGLNSTLKSIFTHFVVYAERFISTYERVPSFEPPHMMLKLLQISSLLVVAQPLIHPKEIDIILKQLNRIAVESYNKIIEDIPTFDLLLEEGRNSNIAALKCYIVDNLKKCETEKPISEIINDSLPLFALQQLIGRLVSEWCPILLNIFFSHLTFIQAFFAHLIFQAKQDVISGKIKVSPLLQKSIEGLTKFDESSLWLPELNNETLKKTTLIFEGDNEHFGEILKLLRIGSDAYTGLIIPKITTHEQVKILIDATCCISQQAYNAVSMTLQNDISKAMASFAPLYLMSNFMMNLLHDIALQPSYFTVPAIYLKQKEIVESMNYGAASFFSSFNMNNVYITKIHSFGELIKVIYNITYYSDLTILYPIQKFDFKVELNQKDVIDHRIDMTDLICNYRTLKSDLVECLLLNEKSNLEIIANKIAEVSTKVIGLLNYIDSSNIITQRIVEGYSKFAESLPRIYTYKLSSIHLRESLDSLDVAIDESIDYIAVKLYETINQEMINELINQINNKTFQPNERNKFIHNFTNLIKEILSNNENDEELLQTLNEILMLIEDNEIYEVKSLVKALPDDINKSLLKCIKDSDYCKYIIKIEKYNDEIKYSNTYIWYKYSIKNIIDKLKTTELNNDIVKSIDELTKDLNVLSIDKIEKNINKSLDKSKIEELKELQKQCERVKTYLVKLQKDYDNFIQTISTSTSTKGPALIYKNSIKQIIHMFYNEYQLQDWDNESFESLCKIAISPIETNFSSDSIADSLIFSRRLMRKLRLTKTTVQSKFVTNIDLLLTSAEKSLRELYIGIQKTSMELMKKQKIVVDNYVETFKKLKDSQIKKFVVRLMNNLSLDIATMDDFNASVISQDVKTLYEEMNSAIDKSIQIQALIHFIEGIEKSILPVDYDRLLEILHKLLENMNSRDEVIFDYEQDAIIELALKLSDCLAQLYSIRNSLMLVKDMHKLIAIKDKLFKFISELILTYETYAEEINVFKSTGHPILGVLNTIPVMCEKLSALIEKSFMLQMKKEDVEAVIDAMKEYAKSCPKEIAQTMETAVNETIDVIQKLNN
ncbi:hypothetical protein GPJ56_004793 [Histomonas meleagridis]|uniref:uncharacterized protein n=1 Tax=Histomonas meleagridis TaxID=135588 RepID=UPI0035596285|nr:hypothetical protein GPJ56_004793 [Histomonas meleagridis]KAH0801691.1 hypothetical protein GO595_005526 [Histomonas meleagridis]